MTNANDPINPINKLDDVMRNGRGLSKREYFAAMALQGMLAKYGTDYQKQHAEESVYMADALINALNQTEK